MRILNSAIGCEIRNIDLCEPLVKETRVSPDMKNFSGAWESGCAETEIQ